MVHNVWVYCDGRWVISSRLLHQRYGHPSTSDWVHTHLEAAAMYIVARMFLGFGIVFAIVSGSAMLGELAYPKERPVMTSLFNASWFLGSLIASGITVRTATINTDWGWRIPSLLQACPSLIQIFFVL